MVRKLFLTKLILAGSFLLVASCTSHVLTPTGENNDNSSHNGNNHNSNQNSNNNQNNNNDPYGVNDFTTITNIGLLPSDDALNASAVQADGKIVAVGWSYNTRGLEASHDFAVARYNTNGTLDNSFGTDGRTTLNIVGDRGVTDDYATAVAIQSNGKIVIAGYYDPDPGMMLGGASDFVMMRYNNDGTLDSSFGSDGVVITDINVGSDDCATAMIIQPDGKIIVVGSTASAGGLGPSGDPNFAVVRYNIDGTLDLDFGGTGIVITALGNAGDVANSVVLQADGKIVVTGYSNTKECPFPWCATTSDFAVVRYNSDGSIDSDDNCLEDCHTFNGTGMVKTNIGGSDTAVSAVMQTDGKIVVAGYSTVNGTADFTVVRYNDNGTLDAEENCLDPENCHPFGTGGIVLTDINDAATNDFAYSAAIQNDGKIIVVGYSGASGSNDLAVVRYGTDGTLDGDFGTDGVAITSIGDFNDYATSIIVQASDGKIVVVGYTVDFDSGTGDFALIRYTAEGVLDDSFGTSGITTTDIGTPDSDRETSMAIQSDGKIIVVGYTSVDFALARYNNDGTLDTAFGTNGKVVTDIGGNDANDSLWSIAIQRDGKIVAAGITGANGTDDFAVVRYNIDGTLDDTFGTGGIAITDIGGSGNTDQLTSVAIQRDGKIVAAGQTVIDGHCNFALARYNTNGSLDSGFGTGGIIVSNISIDAWVTSIAVQSDGKIVAVGPSTDGSSFSFTVVRYLGNGTLDNDFGTGGIVLANVGTDNFDVAYSMAIQTDGKILVTGYSNNGGTPEFALVRYNSNGALDTAFGTDGKVLTSIGGIGDDPYSIAVQSDGKIVVAGYTANRDSIDFAVVRYNTDGTLDSGFGTDGIYIPSIGGLDNEAYSVAVQPNGKIVVAGYTDINNPSSSSYDFAVTRF